MNTAFNVFAAYFASLVVAFPAATRIPRVYMGGIKTFKNTLESFNNICEIDYAATYAFATFRASTATARGIAGHGYEVRRIEGDRYMAKRSRVGVQVVEDAVFFGDIVDAVNG